MLSLMLISFKACSFSAFSSFSLTSDHGKKATSLRLLVFCCASENDKTLTTHLCTSLQHLFAVAEHHAVEQVVMPPWLDDGLLVGGVLTGIQLFHPLNIDRTEQIALSALLINNIMTLILLLTDTHFPCLCISLSAV